MVLTKKDFEKISELIDSKLDNKLGKYSENLRSDLMDKMLANHDEVIKKLNDMSTEKLMMLSQGRRRDEKIEDHEARINTIEKKVLIS